MFTLLLVLNHLQLHLPLKKTSFSSTDRTAAEIRWMLKTLVSNYYFNLSEDLAN